MKLSYSEKLKDPRWAKRRGEIIEKANCSCEECGAHEDTLANDQEGSLQVHHVTYVRGREPWDYPDGLLICLCGECHFQRQVLDEEAIFEFARFLRLMPMWHVHSLKKRLREHVDGGWAPQQFDAFLEMMRQKDGR